MSADSSNDAPKPVTIADVARLAGVGLGTASRALNNEPKVSASTRQRVLDAAERLAYVPSPEATTLARGVKRRVALVVPHLSRWFFSAITEGITDELRAADIDVLLYHVRTVEDRHAFFDRLPARRKVDAVAVIAFPVLPHEQERLQLMGVPIVGVGGPPSDYRQIGIDDYVAARQVLDHLVFLGHTRIGMLEAIDPDAQPVIAARTNAYHDVLAERSITLDPGIVVQGVWGSDFGATGMARLLSLAEPPTAVFAHSDEVAAGAIRTLRRTDLRIPDDMSIVGIDDHPLADYLDLTTVRQDPYLQGVRGARLLTRRLAGESGEPEIVSTELVIRRSTSTPWRGIAARPQTRRPPLEPEAPS